MSGARALLNFEMSGMAARWTALEGALMLFGAVRLCPQAAEAAFGNALRMLQVTACELEKAEKALRRAGPRFQLMKSRRLWLRLRVTHCSRDVLSRHWQQIPA